MNVFHRLYEMRLAEDDIYWVRFFDRYCKNSNVHSVCMLTRGGGNVKSSHRQPNATSQVNSTNDVISPESSQREPYKTQQERSFNHGKHLAWYSPEVIAPAAVNGNRTWTTTWTTGRARNKNASNSGLFGVVKVSLARWLPACQSIGILEL